MEIISIKDLLHSKVLFLMVVLWQLDRN